MNTNKNIFDLTLPPFPPVYKPHEDTTDINNVVRIGDFLPSNPENIKYPIMISDIHIHNKPIFDKKHPDYDPDKNPMFTICNSYNEHLLTIREIAEVIESGYSFQTGLFNEPYTVLKNSKGQRYLAFDIDSGYPINLLMGVCEKTSLLPNFLYETFTSDSQFQKYRVFYLLPFFINRDDDWIATVFKKLFVSLFPEKWNGVSTFDSASFKMVQHWFPTDKKVRYFHSNPIDIFSLLNAPYFMYEKTGRNKLEAERNMYLSGLISVNNHFDIDSISLPESYIVEIESKYLNSINISSKSKLNDSQSAELTSLINTFANQYKDDLHLQILGFLSSSSVSSSVDSKCVHGPCSSYIYKGSTMDVNSSINLSKLTNKQEKRRKNNPTSREAILETDNTGWVIYEHTGSNNRLAIIKNPDIQLLPDWLSNSFGRGDVSKNKRKRYSQHVKGSSFNYITSKQIDGNNRIDYQKLSESCKMVNKFLNTDEYMNRDERIRIVTNLYSLYGGRKQIEERILKGIEDKDVLTARDRWELIIDQVEINSILNISSCQSCPYYSECELASRCSDDTRNTIYHHTLPDVSLYSPFKCHSVPEEGNALDTTRMELFNIMNPIISLMDILYPVTLIKSPPGTGKTENLIKLSHSMRSTVIAFPTHNLKDEVFDRFGDSRINIQPTPPDITDYPKYNDLVMLSYKMKKSPVNILGDMLKDASVSNETKQVISDYLNDLSTFQRRSENIKLTTHHHTYHQDIDAEMIIYDEDIVSTSMDIKTVTLGEFDRFYQFCKTNHPVAYQYLKQFESKPDKIFPKKEEKKETQYLEAIREYLLTNPESEVDIFFSADVMVYSNQNREGTFAGLSGYKFPENKKIVILSATADVNLYKRIFGERLVVHDLMNVKNKGKLYAFVSKTYSRTSLFKKEYREHYQEIFDVYRKMGNIHMISFLQTEEADYKLDGLNFKHHYGSIEGLDELKGKNLLIFGTPSPPDYVPVLIDNYTGGNSSTKDIDFKHRLYREKYTESLFWLPSENSSINDIYVGLIRSEIEQAIGRARLVDEDCIVYLYTKYTPYWADYVTVADHIDCMADKNILWQKGGVI